MRRLLAVCTAVVLVLPAQAATAASPKAPSPISDLAPYQLSGPVHLQWSNPKDIDRVVARLAPGSAAPITPDQGRKINLARTAHTATLRGLRPGAEYSVTVWTRRATALSRPTKISFATKPTHRARAATGTLSARVTDKAGHPLHNVFVDAYGLSSDVDRTASTGRDGRFRLHLPAGDYVVDVEGLFATGGGSDATGYSSVVRTISMTVHHVHASQFALSAAGAVTGTVTDTAGHPLSGVGVAAQMPQPYLEPSFGFGSTFFGGGSSTGTGRNGKYTLKGLDPNAVVPCFQTYGGYRAKCATESVAASPGHTTTAPTIALTKTTSRTGTIFGRISAASGRPLRGVGFVSVSSNTGNGGAFLPIFRDGRFEATGLAPGRWQVCAWATTGGPLGLVQTCVRRTVTVGHRTKASIELKTGGALSGRAIGPSGIGVPNAFVAVSSSRGVSEGTATDQHGYFSLAGLASGDYRICFTGHNSGVRGDATGVTGGCLKRRIHAEAGRDRIGVDRTLPVAGAAAGRITDSAGHPLSGVAVLFNPLNAHANDFGPAQATTGRDGRFRLTDLAPGRYRVCADRTVGVYATDQSRCRAHLVTIARGHTVRGVDIRLLRRAFIHVRVTDSSGHPLAGVEVAALRSCTDRYACPPQPVFAKHRVGVDSVSMTDGRGRATITVTRSANYAVCALGYYAARVSGTSPTGYADKCTGSTYSIAASPSHAGSASIALDDGAAATGRVINQAGHGVRNAELHISGSPVDDIASSYSGFSDPFDGPEPTPFADNLTDTSGRYTIHSIRPGQAEVCARNAKGYENSCLSDKVGLAGGTTTAAPDLTLPPQVAGKRGAAASAPVARRPAWQEFVVDGRVIERRPVSARPAPFTPPFASPRATPFGSRLTSSLESLWASPFGRTHREALTTQLALAGAMRRVGS